MSTYIVKDPAVRDQLAEILTPHQTDTAPSPRERRKARDAEQRISHLESDLGQTQDLLAKSTTALAAEREKHDHTTARVVELETEVAQTTRDLENTRETLAAKKDALNQSQRDVRELRRKLDTVGHATAHAGDDARNRDRKAFEALAVRMEQQAMSQNKTVGDVLRLAARAVRDEITAVYSPAKKAS